MAGRVSGPSLRDIIENLRMPMPFGRKIRLMLRNYWIRIVRRQDCCGHPDEPGC